MPPSDKEITKFLKKIENLQKEKQEIFEDE